MRWRAERRSDNIEDRRGMRPAGIAIGGAGSLIILIIALLLGADPRELFTQIGAHAREHTGPVRPGSMGWAPR